MLEVLTPEEIIAKSQVWQSKISAGDPISIEDLFDLTKAIVQIRASVGLTDSYLGGTSTFVLPYRRRTILIIFGSRTAKEKFAEITFGSDNPQGVSETLVLVEKPGSEAVLSSHPLVSMVHRVDFTSPILGERCFIPRKEVVSNRSISTGESKLVVTLARTIWQSHLEHRAPFKDKYLTSKLASSAS